MNAVQSKLSRDEKENVREMIRDFRNFGGQLFFFKEERVTIAMAREFPGARFVRVGVAHAAPTETKFRKLYGAMLAIERTDSGMCSLSAPIALGNEKLFAAELVEIMVNYSF